MPSKRYYGYLLTLLCAAIAQPALAQEEAAPMPVAPPGSVAEKLQKRGFDDTQVLLKQEFTFGGMIHSQGWGLLLRRSKNKTFMRKRVFELEAVSMEHPKEISTVNIQFESAGSYVYGELNQVVVTRLGYGRHNVLFAKFDKGVEVRWLYLGGITVAWAKPIYLEILKWRYDPYLQYWVVDAIASERYDPAEHEQNDIYGRSSAFKGIDEMRLFPGAYVKTGFSFDYAKRQKTISSIEAGVIFDFYGQGVPMMAYNEPSPYYLTFYVGLHFGTRWYRKYRDRHDN